MRYHEIIMEGRREFLLIDKDVTVYHATHKALGLVLTNREVKTYDSIGTWLSSSKEMVLHTYGPRAASYTLPKGRYMVAPPYADLRSQLASCLPMIDKHVGSKQAEIIANHGSTQANIRYVARVRKRAIEMFPGRGLEDAVRSMFETLGMSAWDKKDRLYKQYQRYKDLSDSRIHNAYRDVVLSAGYMKEYRSFLEGVGYSGIVWNQVHWDQRDYKANIFLAFHTEDLHPIETFERPIRK